MPSIFSFIGFILSILRKRGSYVAIISLVLA